MSFYPKDNTPGCTRQACAFAASYEQFKALDVVVIGASAQQLEDLQHRLGNYYDANGLSSIEVNGNCIAMIFNVDEIPGSIERVKGHICDLVMVM